jgi:putative FmdB family regulatory protein
MPIFEYSCARCGGETTWLALASSPERPRCQSCGSRRLERLISVANLGGRPPADDRALRGAPREFLERPERFGQAMHTLSARTGMRLPSEAVDGAMHRLAEAKKKL